MASVWLVGGGGGGVVSVWLVGEGLGAWSVSGWWGRGWGRGHLL